MATNKNINFNEAYNEVGHPGAVFDTQVDDGFGLGLARPQEGPPVVITFDREAPEISSYKLLAFYEGGAVAPDTEVMLTLQLTSPLKLPFVLDLTSDLIMALNGVPWKFVYVTPWANNTAVIKFIAPHTEAIYKITFRTAFPINTNTSTSIQVIALPTNGFCLETQEIQPSDSRDVTIVKVTAVDVLKNSVKENFAHNASLSSSSIDHTTSLVKGTLQSYVVPTPSTNPAHSGHIPVWYSFNLEAYHLNFSTVALDLRLKGPSGAVLWSCPVTLPPPSVNKISFQFPFPTWNDDYTLMLDLFDLGWIEGSSFELLFTHSIPNNTPVAVINFTVWAADPSDNPVTIDTHVTDPALGPSPSDYYMDSIFPVVWVKGITYMVYWSDWLDEAPNRVVFEDQFAVDGLGV